MNDHFDRNLSLSEFARLSGRSISAFKQELKTVCGETPMKWFISKRVEQGGFLIKKRGRDGGGHGRHDGRLQKPCAFYPFV